MPSTFSSCHLFSFLLYFHHVWSEKSFVLLRVIRCLRAIRVYISSSTGNIFHENFVVQRTCPTHFPRHLFLLFLAVFITQKSLQAIIHGPH